MLCMMSDGSHGPIWQSIRLSWPEISSGRPFPCRSRIGKGNAHSKRLPHARARYIHQDHVGSQGFGSVAVVFRTGLCVVALGVEGPRLSSVTQADIENLPQPF